MSIISESEKHYERILRERDEARELLASEKTTRDHIIKRGIKMQQERDEAREELENVKLQLRLWEDGNIICEETLGEIRLLNEQINGAFRERDGAMAERDEAREALAAEIKHHVETTVKWNGHHMLLTIAQCDLNKALREREEARADAAQLADRLSGLELRTTEELARLERELNSARHDAGFWHKLYEQFSIYEEETK
jgi:hypothetical protein